MLRRCFSPIFCNSMYPSKFYYPHYSLNIKKGMAHFSSMHSEQLWCLSHVSQFTQRLYLLLSGALIPFSFDIYTGVHLWGNTGLKFKSIFEQAICSENVSKWSIGSALRIISPCPQNILDGPFYCYLNG